MAVPLYGYSTRADGATLADGSWDATFVLNNLKTTDVSLPARSANVTPASTRFRFDFGANYAVRALDIAHHTLTESAFWRARLGTAPFDVDFGQGTTDSRLAASGGANGTYYNENGVLTAGSAPRWDCDRLDYVNGFLQSEDVSNASWSVSTNSKALDSKTVVFGSTGTMQLVQFLMDLVVDTYTISGWVRLVSGDGRFQGIVNNVASSTYTATGTWTRFSLQMANPSAIYATGAGGISRTGFSDGVLQFKQLQLQRGTGTKPYRKTTTSRIYAVRGLLAEEARTNLLLQSADLSNASWTKTHTTVTVNGATAPDGTVAMDFLKEDNLSGLHETTQAATYTASTAYAVSCFAKVGVGTRNLQLIMNLTGGGFGIANFTVSGSNFVAGSITTGGTNPFTAGKLYCVAMGQGIFWLTYSATAAGTAGAGTANFRLDNGSFTTYTGDNTSGHYLWGMQLEAGAATTSHIPTTTGTVARTADVNQATSTNFSSWISQGRGTLYCEFAPRFDSGSSVTNIGVCMSDGTGNNRIEVNARTSDDLLVASIVTGGVQQASVATAAVATYDGVFSRVAIGYDTNNVKAAMNGSATVLISSATMPSTLSQIDLGRTSSINWLNGWVRRPVWWPYQVTDTQLTTLTTLGAGTSVGPASIDYDTGWTPALQFGFAQDDVPSDWGKRGYNLMTAFSRRTARYGTVEIMDPNNGTGTLDLGRLFVCGGLQPAYGPSYGTIADARDDLSSAIAAESGKEFGTARRRPRRLVQSFKFLTQAEANEIHQIQDLIGTVGEILYVPDPSDMARSQEYGGLGTLKDLSPIEYAYQMTRGTTLAWKEKF